MKPNFMNRIAKIIEEASARTCIDEIEAEIIEEILQDSLNEYCTLLNEYYEEECYIAISSARNKAYDDGHSDGYADGYDIGYDDGHAAGKSSLEGDIDNAYDEGYALGYSDGHSEV